MKKWIIAVVIVGLLGYAVYDFTASKSESTSDIQSAQVDPDETSESDEQKSVNAGGKVGLNKGDMAPDFEIETIDGEVVQLSDYRGEKIILNFWATWCPPCRTEMPDMQKFHEETDATILAVNLTETEKGKDPEDRVEQVKGFLDEYGVTFTVLSDAGNSISTLYKASALPTSYLINTKGEVHNIAIGALTYEMMVQAFDEME